MSVLVAAVCCFGNPDQSVVIQYDGCFRAFSGWLLRNFDDVYEVGDALSQDVKHTNIRGR